MRGREGGKEGTMGGRKKERNEGMKGGRKESWLSVSQGCPRPSPDTECATIVFLDFPGSKA